jgi:hypothetical protein
VAPDADDKPRSVRPLRRQAARRSADQHFSVCFANRLKQPCRTYQTNAAHPPTQAVSTEQSLNNSFQSLADDDLSPDLHVALFEACFMRVSLIRRKGTRMLAPSHFTFPIIFSQPLPVHAVRLDEPRVRFGNQRRALQSVAPNAPPAGARARSRATRRRQAGSARRRLRGRPRPAVRANGSVRQGPRPSFYVFPRWSDSTEKSATSSERVFSGHEVERSM